MSFVIDVGRIVVVRVLLLLSCVYVCHVSLCLCLCNALCDACAFVC